MLASDSLLNQFRISKFTNKDDWIAARRRGIGASDTAGIMGYGYKGQNQSTIWAGKCGIGSELEETEQLVIGTCVEPGVANVFTYKTGKPTIDPGDYTIFHHPTHDFIFATNDRLTIEDDGLIVPVELKNVGLWNKHEWRDQKAPLKFLIQILQQIECMDVPYGYLCALIGGNEAEVVKVYREHEFFESLVEKTLRPFWNFVLQEVPPPIDFAASGTAEFLDLMHPDDDGKAVVLNDHLITTADELEEVKAQIKELKLRQEALKNQIKYYIGDHTYGVLSDGRCFAWESVTRHAHEVAETTYKQLKEKRLPKSVEFVTDSHD